MYGCQYINIDIYYTPHQKEMQCNLTFFLLHGTTHLDTNYAEKGYMQHRISVLTQEEPRIQILLFQLQVQISITLCGNVCV